MKFRAFSASFLIAFLLACGGSSGNSPAPSPPPKIAVTGVTLYKSEFVLRVGESEALYYSIQPSNADNKSVAWSSSSPGIASVVDGLVTAISGGVATITVTTNDGSKIASCELTVPTGAPSFHWAVAGEEGGQAVLWTDNATYNLGNGVAKSVAVSNDGTLYVVGEQDGCPVLWLGDKFSKFYLSTQKGRANEVLIHGDDVYIAGTVNDSISYWKNDVLTISITNPSYLGSNSEGKSIAVDSDGRVRVVGSLFYNNADEYGTIWQPALFPYTSRFAPSAGTTVNKVIIVNDTILTAGIYYNTVLESLLAYIESGSREFSAGRTFSNVLSSFDVVPFDFKIESTLDNSVLLATSIGLYKVDGVPNKARFDEYGFGAGSGNKFDPITLLPGYGYTKAVRLLGDSIYAAGKNDNGAVIWKDGLVLRQLSATGEAHSLLVR